MPNNTTTTREGLTRYRNYAGSECYLVADVEARDQAREAEIRALIAKWKAKLDAYDAGSNRMSSDEAGQLSECFDEIESLLTPASQEGTK
jgi:hypothetical protein